MLRFKMVITALLSDFEAEPFSLPDLNIHSLQIMVIWISICLLSFIMICLSPDIFRTTGGPRVCVCVCLKEVSLKERFDSIIVPTKLENTIKFNGQKCLNPAKLHLCTFLFSFTPFFTFLLTIFLFSCHYYQENSVAITPQAN